MPETRSATPDDARDACQVLRRSIQELCEQDHGNRSSALDPWLADKTPEDFRNWLDDPRVDIVLATDAGSICGVAACHASGEILLNYVSPDHRFKGISRLLLGEMESRLAAAGTRAGFLNSTRTALRFYRSHGWEPAADQDACPDACCQRLTKALS